MSTVLQITRPTTKLEAKSWLMQRFKLDDNGLIPVSIWLESAQEETEIVADVVSLLNAYGFAIPGLIDKAPGSSFFFFMGKSEHNPEDTQKNKRALEQNLKRKTLPLNQSRKRAASKLIARIERPTKNKGRKIIVIGSMLIGSVLTGIGEGVGTYLVELLKSKEPHTITQPLEPAVPHKSKPPHKLKSNKPVHPNAQTIIVINLNAKVQKVVIWLSKSASISLLTKLNLNLRQQNSERHFAPRWKVR